MVLPPHRKPRRASWRRWPGLWPVYCHHSCPHQGDRAHHSLPWLPQRKGGFSSMRLPQGISGGFGGPGGEDTSLVPLGGLGLAPWPEAGLHLMGSERAREKGGHVPLRTPGTGPMDERPVRQGGPRVAAGTALTAPGLALRQANVAKFSSTQWAAAAPGLWTRGGGWRARPGVVSGSSIGPCSSLGEAEVPRGLPGCWRAQLRRWPGSS